MKNFHVTKTLGIEACYDSKCPLTHFQSYNMAVKHQSRLRSCTYVPAVNNKKFRQKLNVSQDAIALTKARSSYFFKIKSISFYTGPLFIPRENLLHNLERHERFEKIRRTIGKGKVIDRFLIHDRAGKPQIHEIYDNGRDRIYDKDTHKVITEFVIKEDRMRSIYQRVGVVAPKGIVQVASRNQSKDYNAL